MQNAVARILELASATEGSPGVEVKGNSMGAALPAGSFVKVDTSIRGRLDRVAIGDILVFSAPDGQLVIHRLLKSGRDLRGELFGITLGDGCIFCDAPLCNGDLLGRAEELKVGEEVHSIPAPSQPVSFVSATVIALVSIWAKVSTPSQRSSLTRWFRSMRSRRSQA